MSIETSEYDEWSSLIGRFMTTFARVEFSVARALIDHSEMTYQQFKDLEFTKRANKLRSYVVKMPLRHEQKRSLHNALEQLVALADTRNLIAHNPVDLSLESIFEDEPWLEIRSLRDQDKNITKTKLYEQLNSLNSSEAVLH